MKTFPKPLTAREEREYLERYKEGDQEARAALIERNMRLVAHVVKKYQCTDYEMEDLLSVGTIGLIKAVNTFKMDRGSRLATYAAKCVENAILSQWRKRICSGMQLERFSPYQDLPLRHGCTHWRFSIREQEKAGSGCSICCVCCNLSGGYVQIYQGYKTEREIII